MRAKRYLTERGARAFALRCKALWPGRIFDIHHQIDETYFRPTFVGWQTRSVAS